MILAFLFKPSSWSKYVAVFHPPMKSLINEVAIEQYPKSKNSFSDEDPTEHKVIQKGSGLNIYLKNSVLCPNC